MSSSTDVKIIGDFATSANSGIIVKIQNVFSKLWAYAPNTYNTSGKTPILVEPDSVQFAPNELVRATLSYRTTSKTNSLIPTLAHSG